MSLTANPIIRSITNEKIVKSSLLNYMGMQVFRTIAAKAIYKLRPTSIDSAVRKEVAELRQEGIVVFNNFLPNDVFEMVREECMKALDQDMVASNIHDHGATKVKMARLNNCDSDQFVNTLQFYNSPTIKHIFEAVEKRAYSPSGCHWAAEHVVQGSAEEEDQESTLHSDIFYNTHKAWLYLTDVEEKDGPLVFVRRSHKMSISQLGRIYRHSINPVHPSRRITQDELDERGFKEQIMVSPKNTLVIANTCGYHRRLKGQPGGQRYALHVSMRSQPFLLWKNKPNLC